MAASSNFADPRSASGTRATTLPGHSSKLADSDQPYALNCDEPRYRGLDFRRRVLVRVDERAPFRCWRSSSAQNEDAPLPRMRRLCAARGSLLQPQHPAGPTLRTPPNFPRAPSKKASRSEARVSMYARYAYTPRRPNAAPTF